MIRRDVALMGTARPSPTPATAVLMPTIRPRASANAPPELPGLRAASVWMTSSITRRFRPDQTGMERPSPLTTPAVTEPESPSGLPTAMTSWPTRSNSASPISAGAAVGALPWTTARSDSGSAPTTSTAVLVPSAKSSLAGLGAAHHMGVREQIPVRGEQHGRTGADPEPAVASVAGHFERGDVRGDSLGHADDRCGIGIQRVLGHFGSGYPADGFGQCAPPANRYSSKSTTAAPAVVLVRLRRQRNTPDEAAAVQQFSPARIRG